GAGGAGDEDQAAGLVAQTAHDRRESESIKALNFPGDGTEDGANRASLIETVAAEAGQVFQAEGKVELEIFLETVLLRVGEHAVSERLGVGSGQRRHIQRAQVPV